MPPKKVRPSNSAKSRSKRRPPPPIKVPNIEVRKREYLTPDEVKRLRDAAKTIGRYPFRDFMIIVMLYRHALRVSELIDMTWEQVDLGRGRLHVNRVKNGDPSVHYLEGDEIRWLRKLKKQFSNSPFLFQTERGGPLSARTVHYLVARAGEIARLPFSVHPHMLRHAKGFQLAGKGIDTRAIQGYFGHRNIQHTVLYTKLDPRRFKGFGKDY